MNKLLKRFDEIIEYNKHKDEVLAFIGMGSMSSTNRIDDYSDIDFFIIVKNAYKQTYLKHMDWLNVKEISWWYQETKDGIKAMYEDGIYLEFAVFTEDEIKDIDFYEGTIYYQSKDIDKKSIQPKQIKHQTVDITYEINTLLSNLYVGLLRQKRGEKAAAFLMIQVYATNHLLKVLDEHPDDMYVVERRIEQRLDLNYEILYGGISNNIESAKYQLELIKHKFDLNASFLKEIEQLL